MTTHSRPQRKKCISEQSYSSPATIPACQTQSTVTMRPRSFGSTGALRASTARQSTRRGSPLATSSGSSIPTSGMASAPFNGLSNSTAPTIQPIPYDDPLPDFPAWAACLLAGALTFGFIAAIGLWLVQFYHPVSRTRVKTKRGYHRVENEEYEMECYSTGTPRWPTSTGFAGQTKYSTSPSSTPVTDSVPGVRRRKPKNLSVDTNVTYTGLGIAVPGQQNHYQPSPALLQRKSSSESSSSDDSPWQKSHPLSAPASTRDLLSHLPRFERTKKALRELRYRKPDLCLPSYESSSDSGEDQVPFLHHSSSSEESIMESGLLPLIKPLDKPSKYTHHHSSSPYLSPNGSPDSSRSSSRVRLVLDKVEDGIEWATERAVRMFHDQMREDDREEGLLLPVRAEERVGVVAY